MSERAVRNGGKLHRPWVLDQVFGFDRMVVAGGDGHILVGISDQSDGREFALDPDDARKLRAYISGWLSSLQGEYTPSPHVFGAPCDATITLPTTSMNALRSLGGGSISVGIQRLIDEYARTVAGQHGAL